MKAQVPLMVGMLVAVRGVVAQPGDRNSIDIKVRHVGSEEWLDEVAAMPGDTIEVASFYFRDRGIMFAHSIHSIIASTWDAATGDAVAIVDNPQSALHPDGRRGYFNFGGQRQDIYTTGIDAGRMRISAFGNPNNILAGGILVRQQDPVSGWQHPHDYNDGILAFRFNITIGSSSAAVRDMQINAPIENMATFGVYMTNQSQYPTSVLNDYDGSDPATIHVIPAPSGAAVLAAIGVLFMAIRKR